MQRNEPGVSVAVAIHASRHLSVAGPKAASAQVTLWFYIGVTVKTATARSANFTNALGKSPRYSIPRMQT